MALLPPQSFLVPAEELSATPTVLATFAPANTRARVVALRVLYPAAVGATAGHAAVSVGYIVDGKAIEMFTVGTEDHDHGIVYTPGVVGASGQWGNVRGSIEDVFGEENIPLKVWAVSSEDVKPEGDLEVQIVAEDFS